MPKEMTLEQAEIWATSLKDDKLQRHINPQEFIALSKEYDDVELDECLPPRIYVCFTTPKPISLSLTSIPKKYRGTKTKINLGKFRIKLPLMGYLSVQWDVRTLGLNPTPSKLDENYPHPNVDDEIICLGDMGDTVGTLLKAGNLIDVATIISNLLNTQNQKNGYVPIGSWLGLSQCTANRKKIHNIGPRAKTYDCWECGESMCYKHKRRYDNRDVCEECYEWLHRRDKERTW